MSTSTRSGVRVLSARTLRMGSLGIAAAVVAMIMIMLVPLPTVVLDLLLTFNLGFALVVLLTTMYTREPLDFSVFPSLLLLLTLFRLAMNVATTRLVLTNGYAGHVIAAFGNFVVGGNYLVGAIVFIIIVVIQFVVITKGAGRIAEVAARFTLDAMPGKQMAIDADVNAGLISEDEARRRRRQIAREAEFYGAMDGASKFVRGDAVAGLVVTVINIVGGFVIGMVQRGMSAGDSARLYTQLTIGDGLVNQIPSLIISTAAGILVTRSTSERDLGTDLLGQIFMQPRALQVAAAMLGLLGLVPGLPSVPFLALAGGLAIAARTANRSAREDAQAPDKKTDARPTPAQEVGELLEVDPLELEIGYGLINLVEPSMGGDLLDRISMIRRQLASDLGIVVPPIRIRDNARLRVNEYVVKLRGVEIARAELNAQGLLAMNPGGPRETLRGTPTTEPVFGLPAIWIGLDERDRAERNGYTVVESVAVLATHVTELLKRNSHELLTRQDVQTLVDGVKKMAPAVVEELIPHKLTVGGVQKVLQGLLREQVSVRDLTQILEALADHAGPGVPNDLLIERVRHAIARSIAHQHAAAGGKVLAITLDAGMEEDLRSRLQETEGGRRIIISPDEARELVTLVAAEMQRVVARGDSPVILTHPALRAPVRRLIETSLPGLPVLSFAEIVPPIEAVNVGTARRKHAA